MPAQARSAASRSICSAAATTAAETSIGGAHTIELVADHPANVVRYRDCGEAVAVVDLPAPAALDEDRAPDQVLGHADDEEGIAAGARVDHSGHRVEGAIRRETTGQVLAHG